MGCSPWGCTELDTAAAAKQQQQSSSSKAAAAFLQALCSVSPPICPWQITPSLPTTHTCQWFPFPLEAKANILPMASEGPQDPVSPTSLCRMRRPHTHTFSEGGEGGGGEAVVARYSCCTAVAFLESATAVGVRSLDAWKPHELGWRLGRQHWQGRWAGARREQRYNVPELL